MNSYINILTTLILLIFSCGSKQKPSPPVTLEDNVGKTYTSYKLKNFILRCKKMIV